MIVHTCNFASMNGKVNERGGTNANACLFFIKSKKGNHCIIIKASYVTLYRHAYCFQEHVYQISFEYVLLFLSYEVRLKLCNDDPEAAKGMIKIARFQKVKSVFDENVLKQNSPLVTMCFEEVFISVESNFMKYFKTGVFERTHVMPANRSVSESVINRQQRSDADLLA